MATVIEWRNGPLPAGWDTSGSVTIDQSRSSFAVAVLNTTGSSFRAPALAAGLTQFGVRFYLHLPSSFTMDAQHVVASVFENANNSGHVVSVALTGSSDPGRLRWNVGRPAVSMNTTDVGALIPGTVVRVEMRVDTSAKTMRTGFFERKTDRENDTRASWATDQDIQGTGLRFRFGGGSAGGYLPIGMSRIKVTDTASAWGGRDSSDTLPLPPEIVTVIV